MGQRELPLGIRDCILVINGWGQRVNPYDGLYRFFRAAYHIWHARHAALLMHLTENANMGDVAAHVVGMGVENIHVVPFSYGAGRGLVSLADELDQRNRVIQTALLIDPVTRYGWATKYRALGWLGRDLDYRVPANVRDVWCWRQVNHYSAFQPVGHRPVAQNEQTVIRRQVVLGEAANLIRYAADIPAQDQRPNPHVTHKTIDSDPAVLDEVLDRLRQIVPPPEVAPPPQRSAAA